jgi:hypothetical protein
MAGAGDLLRVEQLDAKACQKDDANKNEDTAPEFGKSVSLSRLNMRDIPEQAPQLPQGGWIPTGLTGTYRCAMPDSTNWRGRKSDEKEIG